LNVTLFKCTQAWGDEVQFNSPETFHYHQFLVIL
jgi:hypothetical protein